MDIETLNRTQIILLTLLVSFVTSIATGIVTVSLLEQAPPGVTETINHVIEKTVEKVVPTGIGPITTTTKETTVIVKEDDLITKSIEKDGPSVVSVWTSAPGTDGVLVNSFVGWGVILSDKGVIATDSGFVTDGAAYTVKTSDGAVFDVKVAAQDEEVGLALLQAVIKDQKYVFVPISIGDDSKLKLGQSVISFGGKERQAIAVGVVSALNPLSEKTNATSSVAFMKSIDASVRPSGDVHGGPLINLFGELIGISVGADGTRYLSSDFVNKKLQELQKPAG